MSPRDKTAAERNARKRAFDKAKAGIVPVTVRVHQTRKEEIKAISRTMREPAEPTDKEPKE